MEDIMYKNNKDFVTSLVPTLAYLVLLMVLGLVGNTVVFLVYYKRFKFNMTRTYILVLSVCDLLNNCVAIPSDIYEIRFHYNFQDDPGCKVFGFFTMCVSLLESFILGAIALAHQRKICQLRAKQRTSRDVCLELICLGVFALCMAAPFGLLKGLQTISIPNSTVNGTTCGVEEKYAGSLFPIVYHMALNLLFIIDVLIISVCYVLIARHLYLHRRRLLLNAQKRQKQGTEQEPQLEIHECAQDKQTVRLFHSQPAKTSANVLTSKYFEDKEDKAVPGEVQVNITEGVEIHNVISDTDQTSRVLPSPLNSIPEMETSFQKTPASGDTRMEHIPTLDTNNSGTAYTRFPAQLKEAEIQADTATSGDNSNTVCKAKLHKGREKSIDSSVKQLPNRTTLMLLIITLVFVVSYLPYLIVIVLFRGQDVVGDTIWVRNLHQIAFRSYFINSAANSLVYSFCSVQFRRECYLFLCRK